LRHDSDCKEIRVQNYSSYKEKVCNTKSKIHNVELSKILYIEILFTPNKSETPFVTKEKVCKDTKDTADKTMGTNASIIKINLSETGQGYDRQNDSVYCNDISKDL
jgi:hypothetical protein